MFRHRKWKATSCDSWCIDVLHHSPSKLERKKGAAAFQWNKRCLTEHRKLLCCLNCTVQLQRVATVWGPFYQWFPYIEPRRCSAGSERCHSTKCQSLAGLSHLAVTWDYIQSPRLLTLLLPWTKRQQSGRDAECMYITQFHSHLIDLTTEEKGCERRKEVCDWFSSLIDQT